ncbi:phosphatase PAP2 family protein [Sporosarcina sp. HYO08]|uniref:phosphatase PAP2 family protein n=1 Tax=Sporosarcina sp. HYO08 TaxID=1759557 RepID=UPI00079832CF|nr:phosphatase PAP2 family protein [Sporosarcina sp. HYO08]KXH80705.1 hypothetical protein AU377_08135 [Sporosarcina sp. HYO08]
MYGLSRQLIFAFFLCVLSGILFGYIANAIRRQTIERFDLSIIHFVQGFETSSLTAVMKFFTWVGSGYIVSIIALIGFLIIYGKLKNRGQALLLVFVVLGTILLNHFLKLYFKRERPEIHRILNANGFSFPSGHSMMAFSLYAIIAYIAWRHAKTVTSKTLLIILSAIMIIMIGVSRIYLGVHYPSDVVGGYAASALWVTASIVVYHFYRKKYVENRLK